LNYEDYYFGATGWLLDNEIEKICRFAKETGLLQIVSNRDIKSIPDYVFGVEVGLDSNGRKNRSGKSMENIIDHLLMSICTKHSLEYLSQVNSSKVFQKWEIDLFVDKSDRRFDFAVNAPKGLYLIETNYYSDGGSKLKSTAGEYQSLSDFLSVHGHKFIWITDGLGWQKTQKPLRETFDHNDYVLNIKMVTQGILEDILIGNL
jgi:type II restriction enzyme